MNGIIIAGTHSGCGKTTITTGLIALLKSLGSDVAPFKVGPDFIDPGFHEKVSGSASYNLDCFLCNASTIKELFYMHSLNKDIAVVEGVMGYYDGMGDLAIGSTYQLAQILGLPVLLVVDCKGSYQSVAAIVKGYANYRNDANIKGVFLNNVYSAEQYSFLKNIIENETGVSCVGYLTYDKDLIFQERHLGLVQADENNEFAKQIETLVNKLSRSMEIDKFLNIASIQSHLKSENSSLAPFFDIDMSGVCLGVALDKAFTFYYKDNLKLFSRKGAKLVYFSPINDASIPKECNALYFGGGYPEIYAQELSANFSMLQSVKAASESDMPIFAECGGLVYLTESVTLHNGKSYNFCGIYNCASEMTSSLQRFGYATLNYLNTQTNTHEFHCSRLIEPENKNYNYSFTLKNEEKKKQWQCGLQRNRTLAGYAHIHLFSNLEFTKLLCNHLKSR